MTEISINKLISAVTKQPFLIWNSLEEKKEINENNLKFDLPSFLDILEVNNFSQLQTKTYSLIERKINKRLEELPNSKIIISKTKEKKVKETFKYLKDESIDIIIDAVFKVEILGYIIYFSTKLFNKKEKSFSLFKCSGSTKRLDFLRFWFIYSLLKEIDIKVKDTSLWILATKEYGKGEIDFFETKWIAKTKDAQKDKNAKEEFDFELMQIAKSGYNNKNPEIIEYLKKEQINPNIIFPQLKTVILRIKEAEKIKELAKLSSLDFNDFSSNTTAIKVRNLTTKFEGWNGNVLPMKNILEEETNNLITFKKFLKGEIKVRKKELEQYFEIDNAKVVWYDFEAFSIPFAPANYMLPFQQAVSQVSVIKTEKMKEYFVKNIIVDPKEYEIENFKLIIDTVYDKEADYYVVYNQSYENTRLREMAWIIKKKCNDKSYLDKVFEIEAKTFDLEKPFKAHRNKIPIILLPETKGRSSIKIIEKYISEKFPKLANKAKVKEYKKLNIKNGMEAMEKANRRALGVIGNKEWNETILKLKEYCENDVRAMIMVYFLIKELVK